MLEEIFLLRDFMSCAAFRCLHCRDEMGRAPAPRERERSAASSGQSKAFRGHGGTALSGSSHLHYHLLHCVV